MVVNTLLSICFKENIRPRPMKLQKLLYFSYGRYLCDSGGKELIDEKFEVWPYGCVVPSVYQAFKHYGYRHIEGMIPNLTGNQYYILSNDNQDNIPKISAIEDTIDEHGRKHDMELSADNHRPGGAWWETLKKGQDWQAPIDIEDIKKEFKVEDGKSK